VAVLTEQMKDLVKSGRCLVVTASKDGWPSAGPKGSVMVVDDSTLAYGEAVGKQTYSNLKENPKVAIVVVDYEQRVGFRFVGTAELETSGELYETYAQRYEKMNRPRPKAAVRIKVEAIYDVAAKNAGVKVS